MVQKLNLYDNFIRIALLVVIVTWSYQLLYPFSGILLWSFILAVIFYPFYVRLNVLIGNHPAISAIIITLCLLLLVTVMTFYITSDIYSSINDITVRMTTKEHVIPEPPKSIEGWPVIGKRLYQIWTSATQDLEEVISKYADVFLGALKYGFTKILHASRDFILFIVSILFSGYIMFHAVSLMQMVTKFAVRVANKNGLHMINMIVETIQNVSRGVIGISLLQTFIFWLLLFIAHAPSVGVLSILALIISIAQIGLFFLVIPIIIWLFLVKSFAFALIISIFLVLDALLDSFLKPFIMARGLSTPMLIIFIGVIGGILAYGMIGVFIGPVILAVAYDLLCQWIGKPAITNS